MTDKRGKRIATQYPGEIKLKGFHKSSPLRALWDILFNSSAGVHLMTRVKRVLTRRDFLRTGTCAAVGGLIALPLLGSTRVKAGEQSRVVLVRNKEVLDNGGTLRPEILEEMLDQAMCTLLEVPDALSGWRRLFKPDDVVGVKSNVWYHLPTPGELETAIQKRLVAVGVKGKNISVDDRGVLRNPVFQNATALINTRPMRTHHWSGLGTLLKNYIMFTPRPSKYHGNACESLGALWQLPHVVGRTRLNILVMLTPHFHGVGPHSFSARYVWPYSGLIISTDPVAADATGARIIQAKRNLFFGKESPISPPPHHIAVAGSRYGLGHSLPDRIELIKLGWKENLLI